MTPLPMREGALLVAALIDLYMAHYAGRDTTRVQRLSWWRERLGTLTLQDVTDDHVHEAMEELAQQPARHFMGLDAANKPIFKAKREPLRPATLNRYSAAIAAVFTWAIKRRITPKGWMHPCRGIEVRVENNGKVRFLSQDERERLLAACKGSAWPKLYLLVLAALTTGARRGELLGLRWRDIDFAHSVAHIGRSKNNDPKVLPLVPAVIGELRGHQAGGDELVFASSRLPSAPFSFQAQWVAALKVARLRSFTFHDLRHSCASYLAQNGATLLEIGDLLGHRSLVVTKRYAHLCAAHRTALVNRVLGDLR